VFDGLLHSGLPYYGHPARVPTVLEEKNSRSFPVQFQNFPGAFGHSSQLNIKHIWTAIVTKRLPNITECNQCQYLL